MSGRRFEVVFAIVGQSRDGMARFRMAGSELVHLA